MTDFMAQQTTWPTGRIGVDFTVQTWRCAAAVLPSPLGLSGVMMIKNVTVLQQAREVAQALLASGLPKRAAPGKERYGVRSGSALTV